LLRHLKVPKFKAQEAKKYLETKGALHEDFLPIKEDDFVFWPVKFEIDGEIVERKGNPVVKKSRDYRSHLSSEIKELAPKSFDIFGDIAIVKMPEVLMKHSGMIADALLISNSNINKVALDSGVTGKYRIRELKLLKGPSGFISTHKENGLLFTIDISKVYFSPRLATERQRIANKVTGVEHVLDAFAGAAPFSVILAKKGCYVTSIDANPESEKWARINFKQNHVPQSNYNFICSRVEDMIESLSPFDRVIMNNPMNSFAYIESLRDMVKLGGIVHFYYIGSMEDQLTVVNTFGADFRCLLTREVHPYSPSSSVMVSDLERVNSTVQIINQ